MRGRHLGRVLCVLSAVLAARMCLADVKPNSLFSDNMVLQQGVNIAVWGWAAPGETVTVDLCGQTDTRAANADGYWRVNLRPLTAGGPFTMTVTANNTITVNINI